MHRDKKIGFALGILLLGIVGAFFFRNEPDPFAELPPLDDPASLDHQISENPISPYTEQSDAEAPVVSPAPNPWHVFEPDRPENRSAIESAGLPVTPGAPDPIQLAAPEPVEPRQEIEVGNPFGEVQHFERTKSDAPLPGNENWTLGPVQPAQPPRAVQRPKPIEPPNSQPVSPPPANLVKMTPPKPEPPAAQTSLYKVVPGDTLSVLAEKHLGSSRRYMEIYEANRDKLRDPDDIRVGMLIRIPPRVKFEGNPPAASSSSAAKTHSSEMTITPENSTPFTQEAKTIPPPPRRETIRFMPFSRSPLGPLPH